MAPCRKLLYFVFVCFFMLAQCPSGCRAGFGYSQPFPGTESKAADTDSSLPHSGEQAEAPKHSFLQIQVKRGGAYRSRDYMTDAPAKDPGDFSACEPCRLGRGKCRRMCLEDEKVVGSCRLNFFCCRQRIY